MKQLFISSVLCFGAVAGCATVSMVPGSVVVESALMTEQNALREVSNAYIETAESQNWVRPSRDLWSFAKMLANGSASEIKTVSYSDFVADQHQASDAAVQFIAADIATAEAGLQEMIDLAEQLLAASSSDATLRTDTYSFESALVTAQKARRNFAEAAYVVGRTYSVETPSVDRALDGFDTVIANAQAQADALAARGTQDQAAGA